MSDLPCGREFCVQCGACEPEEIRKYTQEKAKELGHCLCSLNIKCPCNFFEKFDVCKCANEECGDNCDMKDWISINLVR